MSNGNAIEKIEEFLEVNGHSLEKSLSKALLDAVNYIRVESLNLEEATRLSAERFGVNEEDLSELVLNVEEYIGEDIDQEYRHPDPLYNEFVNRLDWEYFKEVHKHKKIPPKN